MIYTVGGTPEPIIKSILTYKPEICYFLCSEETEPMVTKILTEVRTKDQSLTPESLVRRVKTPEDIIECYRTAHQTLTEARKKYQNYMISIDYTGGTKSMSAGLVLAATKFGNFAIGKGAYAMEPFKYIGGELRDQYGRVVTGHEHPLDRNNPLQEFVIEDVEEAVTFFNNYHFDAAETIFKKCYEKISDPRIKLAQEMAEAFGCWDAFRHAEALGIFSRIMALIKDISKFEILPEDFVDTLRNMEKLLLKLSHRRGPKLNPDYDPKLVALDMICNAERRIENERYDDAAIRAYRAVEMMVAARLEKEYGINMSQPNWVNFERSYPGKKDTLLRKFDNRLPQELYLWHVAILLEVLGSPLFKVFKDRMFDIDNLRRRRNKLILLHGFSRATKDVAEGFLKISKDFIAGWLELDREQLEEQLKRLRFPKLSPEHLIL
jgi:CRISPR-associated protein (TIGR02710 family)